MSRRQDEIDDSLGELLIFRSMSQETILDLFEDEDRAEEFSVRALDMLFDYSKTDIDTLCLSGLLDLAKCADLPKQCAAMFSGEKINETEGRAVLHTALRNVDGGPILVDGQDVMPGVRNTLARMETFASGVRSGEIQAPGGGRYSDVVNIGIGGSDLGPAMAVQALAPYVDGPRCHFISNIDGAHVHDVLKCLNPASTLVIVASKTFATVETMTNAETVKNWVASNVGAETAAGHFVALSSNQERASAFGIDAERVFGFEDWVGGRYSIWGPIGLSLMIAVGQENFREFLAGGAAMDAHFRTAEETDNMPLMLALVGIWHSQVCGYETRAVLPYDQRLARLPAYLQQLEMESNGKGVAMNGEELNQQSAAVVWGEPGTNGQHAFHQLIHQGTRIVPCEFMIAREGHEPELAHQHRLLMANCLAQSEALLKGRTVKDARASLAGTFKGKELNRQAAHRAFPGNRPSTTLAYSKLTPRVLGQIIALYEHRVFVEGALLGINSFDQWGVELGKELALSLESALEGREDAFVRDGSTDQLINFLLEKPDCD